MVQSAAAQFEIEYRQRRAAALVWRALLAVLLAGCLWASAEIAQFAPLTLIEGLPKVGRFFEQFFPNLQWAVIDADTSQDGSFRYWMYAADEWALALLTSINMAVLATIASMVSGFALATLSARNLGMPAPISFAAQRLADLLRTLPDLVLALIFVFAFGIGPFAGLLAIWLHATGALAKLYGEVIENIQMNQIEGLRGAGASWLQCVRFGVLPQILPNVASYGLLRFEINVGAAAAIGFVGGGGIGQEFINAMQAGWLRDASAIRAMVIGVIFVIDMVSERVRHRLIGDVR